MPLPGWTILKLKHIFVLVGCLYFLFMFCFHSSIQPERGDLYADRNGFIRSKMAEEDLNETHRGKRALEDHQYFADIIRKAELLQNQSAEKPLIDPAKPEEFNVEFKEISSLARRSLSQYSNVQPRCLESRLSSVGNHSSATGRKGRVRSSVTNGLLPELEEPKMSDVRKSQEDPANESLSELQRRYRNAKLPFSEPSAVFSENDFQFQEYAPGSYVFSAYLDDRQNDFDNRHNGSYVRFMSLLRTTRYHPALFCVFGSEDGGVNNTLYYSKVSNVYEMCENHGKRFGGFILSCSIPADLASPPCFVTLYTEDPESKDFDISRINGTRVPIRTLGRGYLPDGRPTEEPQRNMTACVSPLHGQVEPSRLVEFIEFSLASGFDRITFYPTLIKPDIFKILEYYILERKVVDIVPWNLPLRGSENIWYFGQLIAIQDCMYRNMAASSYVAFMDLDELILPTKHESLVSFMESIDSEEICGYQFAGSYFTPFASSEVTKAKGTLKSLVTFNSFHRGSKFDKVRTKCIVKPKSIFEKGIHHISKPIFSFLRTVLVDPEGAKLHHFRRCEMYLKASECREKIKDDSIFKFFSKAIRAIITTLQALNLGAPL